MWPTFKFCCLVSAAEHSGNRIFRAIFFSVVFLFLKTSTIGSRVAATRTMPRAPSITSQRSFHNGPQIIPESCQNHVYKYTSIMAKIMLNHGGIELKTCQNTRHNLPRITWQFMLNLWNPSSGPSPLHPPREFYPRTSSIPFLLLAASRSHPIRSA